jgi:hypothetical protein
MCQAYSRHISGIGNELIYSRYISEYSRYIESKLSHVWNNTGKSNFYGFQMNQSTALKCRQDSAWAANHRIWQIIHVINWSPCRTSGILYTWTGFGKMVHTRLYMVQTCMYKDMHVHTCMSMYIPWHACAYMHFHIHACMYSFQYSIIFWQHPSCNLLLEPCCIHQPSTVSHILNSNTSTLAITIYSPTWYIEVHTSIYQYVQCTDSMYHYVFPCTAL